MPQRLMVSGKDRVDQIIEVKLTDLAQVALLLKLSFIFPPFADLYTLSVRAPNASCAHS